MGGGGRTRRAGLGSAFDFDLKEKKKTHYLLENRMVPSRKGATVSSLNKIGTVVLEKIFQFCQCIFGLLYHLPLVKAWPFSLVEISLGFWRRKFFKFRKGIFAISKIISP